MNHQKSSPEITKSQWIIQRKLEDESSQKIKAKHLLGKIQDTINHH